MANKGIQAVLFDLDGVIVSTDEFHFRGWKHLADEIGVYFDRTINERLRGVSRTKSLEILLEQAPKQYSQIQKAEMAARKNEYYRQQVQALSPENILPGVMSILTGLKERGICIAVGSSSKNASLIIEKIGLASYFDAVVDGNEIIRSKPDPEVFLLAAKKLGIPPEKCLVVEDAEAGIEAALAAGMKAMGVGVAADSRRATRRARDLAHASVDDMLN